MRPLPSDVPFACSLSAGDATERGARWRDLLDRAQLEQAAIADGVRLILRAEPDVAAELDALIAAERECCPFMSLATAAAEDGITLEVTAPPDARSVVDELFVARP